MEEVDVIVIGAGPGGYSAAIRLAIAGFSVACVEREEVGGVCLNWGCIPSKGLISVAERFRKVRSAEKFGIDVSGIRLDMSRAQRHNRSVVRHHTSGVKGLLKANGVRIVEGHASFETTRRVAIRGSDGSTRLLGARRAVVISAGVKQRTVPMFEPNGVNIVTAKEAVFLERVPEHLLVLGGGVIGLELGGAFLGLGAKVTVVEIGDTLLPGVDRDLVAVVEREMTARGAVVHTSTRAMGWEAVGDGARVHLERDGRRFDVDASEVLVAAGFVADTTGLNLSAIGVQLDERGHILTRENCETTAADVFAIGDVAGPPYLAHKAFAEALVVSDAIKGCAAKRDWKAMPSVIFTEPEIATVGLTERTARAAGIPVVVGQFPRAALGRAGAQGETEGFFKLLALEGRLVGAGLVGAHAGELVAELALAIEVGATLEDLSLTIHPHPTLSEGVHDAADQALGRAVHVLNRTLRSSLGSRTGAAPLSGV